MKRRVFNILSARMLFLKYLYLLLNIAIPDFFKRFS